MTEYLFWGELLF